jgi:two-component system, LuxR family, response regulator FixJ
VASIGRVRTVYIMESDESVRKSLLRLMLANGVDAKCVTSPRHLLDDLDEDSSGCIVADVTLAEKSGTDLSARLKEMNIDVPIIAISASDDAAIRESAHRIGAQFFLSKPVDDRALLDTIAWVTNGVADRHDADDGSDI